jgi:hypothetical protein
LARHRFRGSRRWWQQQQVAVDNRLRYVDELAAAVL